MKTYVSWAGSLAVAAAAGWFASQALTAPATGKEPRFSQLTLEQLNEQQRPLGEKIMKISSVGISGPYNPLLRSPVLANRMYDLLEYLRWNSSLPPRLSEFAILIQARLWRSQVEWYAHHPLALKAGLAESVAADLKANRRPAGMKPDEEAVYDLAMTLSTKHEISDELFERAKQALGGEQQVVDLIGLSGTYVTVAMVLALAEAGVPPGKELPFKPGEP
jgi:4-carboxymuconolactone decarboxylase